MDTLKNVNPKLRNCSHKTKIGKRQCNGRFHGIKNTIVATMKKNELMKQVRMSIVGLLGCIAFILMVGEPIEEETWLRVFLITKALAFAIGFVSYRLFTYWEAKGLLSDLDEEV